MNPNTLKQLDELWASGVKEPLCEFRQTGDHKRTKGRMKTYSVTIPIVGVAYIEVEADSEDASIEKAMETVTSEHFESWEAKKIICEGNILDVQRNEAEATLIEES